MKNNGYTLAEILVCIGIIGVLAAICIPLVNKYKPDPIKAMYISNYNAILTALREISSNETIYPPRNKGENIDYRTIPLYNIAKINLTKDETVGGNSAKLCELLAKSMNAVGEINCLSSYSSYSDSKFKPSFVIPNGTQYFVTSDIADSSYQTDIYFDVNGKNGNNCLYSDNCKKPDRFKVMVNVEGLVVAADPVGKWYLEKQKNWRKEDIQIADANIDSSLPNDLKNFEVKPIEKKEEAEPTPPEEDESTGEVSENTGGVGSGGENKSASLSGYSSCLDARDISICQKDYAYYKGKYLDFEYTSALQDLKLNIIVEAMGDAAPTDDLGTQYIQKVYNEQTGEYLGYRLTQNVLNKNGQVDKLHSVYDASGTLIDFGYTVLGEFTSGGSGLMRLCEVCIGDRSQGSANSIAQSAYNRYMKDISK